MRGILIMALLLCVSIAQAQDVQSRLDLANKDYKQGELSETINQRKVNFNAALAIYTDLEKTYHPAAGNGKLYFNIGNTYFQLGEYPLAILYYYRALKLMPRFADIKRNLAIAQEKMQLAAPKEVNPAIHTLFFLYYDYSLPERFQIFFVFALAFFLMLFVYLWTPKGSLKMGCIALAVVCVVLLSSLLYTQYFEPLEGVLVKATSLYRDAGKQYAKVLDKPLSGGLKVQVLDMREQGRWLKILTPDGTLGFVPVDSIRLL